VASGQSIPLLAPRPSPPSNRVPSATAPCQARWPFSRRSCSGTYASAR